MKATKMIRSLAAVAALALLAGAVAVAGESLYGAVKLEEATPIADILASPHEYEGKTVRVEGKVSSVCTGMGCWLKVSAADDQVMLARSSGEKILVPTDCVGQKAVVEGVVVLEHPEEEEKNASEEGHTCETAAVRLETSGVVLSGEKKG